MISYEQFSKEYLAVLKQLWNLQDKYPVYYKQLNKEMVAKFK